MLNCSFVCSHLALVTAQKPAGFTSQQIGMPNASAKTKEPGKILPAVIVFFSAIDPDLDEEFFRARMTFSRCGLLIHILPDGLLRTNIIAAPILKHAQTQATLHFIGII